MTGYTDVFMWGEDVAEMQELGDRLLKASALPVLDESDFPSFDEDKTWQEEAKAIEHLRALLGMGYAAVAFTPEELKGVDPDKVQWIENLSPKTKIFLIHGDEQSKIEFAKNLQSKNFPELNPIRIHECSLPSNPMIFNIAFPLLLIPRLYTYLDFQLDNYKPFLDPVI